MAQARYDIHFTGRVQGVGFRATAQSIAREFDIAGWVRNEGDGSVRCVVEGEPREVERFLERIKAEMQGFIRDTRTEKSHATGEFSGFRVAY
jgi:acylphosphatase